MYLVKKMSFSIMLCLLLLPYSQATAETNMNRQFVELISHGGKPYMIASLFQNEKPINRPLLKFENELKGGDDSKQSTLLSEYYGLMIQGQAKKVANLYFEQDGSKERYISGLIRMPKKYAGYSEVERIDFLTSFGWGPFQIIEVNLSGVKGLNLQWREAVICSSKKCFMSNQIDQADSKVTTLGEIRTLLDTDDQAQTKLKSQVNMLSEKAIYLPDDALEYASTQNTQYPLVFSFQMERIKPITIDLNATTKTSDSIEGINLSLLQSLYQELRTLAPLVVNESLQNQTNTEPEKRDADEAYNKVVNKYITEDAGNQMYFYSLYEMASNNKLEMRREAYQPVAVIQRVSLWQSLEILGYMRQGEKQIVVFFQPSSQDAKGTVRVEPMHAIAIESTVKGPKLMLTDFRNNASQTINYAMEAPIVDVLGRKYAKTPTFIYNL